MWIKKVFKKGWFQLSFLVLSLIMILSLTNFIFPKSDEEFLVMSILGENKETKDYFPNDISNISVNALVQWHIYLDNYFNSDNDVSVRVKLLNSTLPSPDDFNTTPSPIPSFINVNLKLTAYEKLLFPFFWSLTEVSNLADSVSITQLRVNDVTLDVDVSAISGSSFRLVFELWIYDKTTQNYEFSLETNQYTYCVWNQLWFNVTTI